MYWTSAYCVSVCAQIFDKVLRYKKEVLVWMCVWLGEWGFECFYINTSLLTISFELL